ncbi:hypothetical protein CURTO8I2_150035 [Curtobacterium sp. 8I-2]|nr:hypothetical protein CURTO8I2_150035 [Curtobacterium sp. 8I-2]
MPGALTRFIGSSSDRHNHAA